MIDFNALLNAAIEAKVAPLRKQLEQMSAQGLAGVVFVRPDGELALTEQIKQLVDARVETGIDKHERDYDHNDFVSEDDLGSKVSDKIGDVFESKFEAALDGIRVTLRT